MTTPTDIAELLRQTAGAVEPITESADQVSVKSSLTDAKLRLAWLRLRSRPPAFIERVTIRYDGSDAELDDDDEAQPSQRFIITLNKTPDDRALRLFFGRSLTDKLAPALAEVDHVLVADMGAGEPFTTYRSRYQKWTDAPPEAYRPHEALPNPKKFTRDFTQNGAVPDDLRPWLEDERPKTPGIAYMAWQDLAAPRLLAAIANHVSESRDGIVSYHFNGPPAREVKDTHVQIRTVAGRLSDGAKWVYGEGTRDAEVRHILLANEWARSHRQDAPQSLGEDSLPSAKRAYDAHVRKASRDTLKAVAELRKAVIDESKKFSDRAHQLSGALWKDLIIAALPFFLKILPTAAGTADNLIVGVTALIAALFLAYSFLMHNMINERYFAHQEDSRDIWRDYINDVLNPERLQIFADDPIDKSRADYNAVWWRVLGAYSVFFVGLIAFAIYQFSLLAGSDGFWGPLCL